MPAAHRWHCVLYQFNDLYHFLWLQLDHSTRSLYFCSVGHSELLVAYLVVPLVRQGKCLELFLAIFVERLCSAFLTLDWAFLLLNVHDVLNVIRSFSLLSSWAHASKRPIVRHEHDILSLVGLVLRRSQSVGLKSKEG